VASQRLRAYLKAVGIQIGQDTKEGIFPHGKRLLFP